MAQSVGTDSLFQHDIPRAAFSPEELAHLTMEFYKRNYIEGLFLSSGILRSPDYTMEQMCRALELLRHTHRFNGYIHVKAIPGASDALLARAGFLADRISINLELPTEAALRRLAPHKSGGRLLLPMGKISDTIALNRLEQNRSDRFPRSAVSTLGNVPGVFLGTGSKGAGCFAGPEAGGISSGREGVPVGSGGPGSREKKRFNLAASLEGGAREGRGLARSFAPAGQSTQLIVGAADETDYDILFLSQDLYRGYDLRRVFFSAYIPVNEDAALPGRDNPVPLLREHRLYQADWLLRFYGFRAEELLSKECPNFDPLMDPKCNWALRHLELFPLEVTTASIELLLRIPGIGPVAAKRIEASRRYGRLDFPALKKMGVVLKRAQYFITCGGRMLYKTPIEGTFIRSRLIGLSAPERQRFDAGEGGRQLSLFSDFGLT